MRHFILFIIGFSILCSTSSTAQVAITEIDEHYTQVDFGFHIMMIHFNIRPANEDFRPLTGGFQITETERKNYVNMVKDEVLKLPQSFITRYVIDNVFILAMKQENILGYHSDDLIIIEGRESQYNMRRTLFHEIAHEVTAKSMHKSEYQNLCEHFNKHRSDGNALSYLKIPQLYETGHSSPYSQKSAEEEFCELFADLMVPNTEMPLIRYISENPESILAEKVRRLLTFFAANHARELDLKFFANLNKTQAYNKVIAKGY